MCYVNIINFCQGNINFYINFDSISSVTNFFHVRILDTFFFLVSQFIYMFLYKILVYIYIYIYMCVCVCVRAHPYMIFKNG